MARLIEGLRALSDEELVSRLAEAHQESFNLRFQHATGRLESFSRLGEVRKEIARVNTLLRQREIEAAEVLAEEREQSSG